LEVEHRLKQGLRVLRLEVAGGVQQGEGAHLLNVGESGCEFIAASWVVGNDVEAGKLARGWARADTDAGSSLALGRRRTTRLNL
jgi:hypothetical protein